MHPSSAATATRSAESLGEIASCFFFVLGLGVQKLSRQLVHLRPHDVVDHLPARFAAGAAGGKKRAACFSCAALKTAFRGQRNFSVAFCSPAKVAFHFQWFNGKPVSWQKVKVLTSKKNAPLKQGRETKWPNLEGIGNYLRTSCHEKLAASLGNDRKRHKLQGVLLVCNGLSSSKLQGVPHVWKNHALCQTSDSKSTGF